jgi:hypothetical protein
MRFPLTASWGVGYGESRRLQFLLYVRDAAGLIPRGCLELPPLYPAVPGDGPRPSCARGLDGVSGQWRSWWTETFGTFEFVECRRLPEPRRDLPELADRPELQRIARDLFDEAQAWLDLRVAECARSTAQLRAAQWWLPVECDIVQEAIAARGWLKRFAAVGPFQLNVSGLPLAGMHGWRISPEHALVTRALRQDPAAYREWLLPVVAELLRSRPVRDTARPM